jgi:hypothetical protein
MGMIDVNELCDAWSNELDKIRLRWSRSGNQTPPASWVAEGNAVINLRHKFRSNEVDVEEVANFIMESLYRGHDAPLEQHRNTALHSSLSINIPLIYLTGDNDQLISALSKKFPASNLGEHFPPLQDKSLRHTPSVQDSGNNEEAEMWERVENIGKIGKPSSSRNMGNEEIEPLGAVSSSASNSRHNPKTEKSVQINEEFECYELLRGAAIDTSSWQPGEWHELASANTPAAPNPRINSASSSELQGRASNTAQR